MSLDEFGMLDSAAAAERLAGHVVETPLTPFASGDKRVELRLKLECLQHTKSFKVRGAWNNISQLTAAQKAAGVVATSSGNHAQALAWAAKKGGSNATIFMPENVFPNKVEACRSHGAEVVLLPTRAAAEQACAEAVAAGATLVHAYKADATIEGAGTVGVEIAAQWPEVDVVVVPVGGGGLITGTSLALHRALGSRSGGPPVIIGAEPQGAANLFLALAAGAPVTLDNIDTEIQGLCPLDTGDRNVAVCSQTVDRVMLLADEDVYASQRRLVKKGGWVVEPAGAAAAAVVLLQSLPAELLAGRSKKNPLRVAAVVSGGNPDPVQLAELMV